MNRCVWREKCLEYGGEKCLEYGGEKKKKKKKRKKKELAMFWIRSTDDRLVTNKNYKQKTINKVWVGKGGRPTTDLANSSRHQQPGQCFALSESNGADEGPVCSHCHGLSG